LEKAERERVKVEPGLKVEEERKPSLKRVKKEQGTSNGGGLLGSRGGNGKIETIELD